MLEELRIQGLGVIDDAVLELGPGLTVVTGETGAGKTMVVQGLALLFGGRSDAGRVRPGAARAVVEGRLLLPEDHAATVRALEAGAVLDDGALLVGRSVGADGRSRAVLGGRSAPVGVLGELGETVMAMHGQSDQQRLLSPARQRAALDRYAGGPVLDLRAQFAGLFTQWREVRAELTALRTEVAERARTADQLRVGLLEVEQLSPLAGEDTALQGEIARLAHADDLRQAATTAQQALTGTEGGDDVDALGLVTAARRALDDGAALDPTLAPLAAQAKELGLLAADLAGELASYASGVDTDPARLAAAQDRLAALTTLVRRHGTDSTDSTGGTGGTGGIDGVLTWAQAASVRLLELDGTGDQLVALAADEHRLTRELGDRALELSTARVLTAERFGTAVSAELGELAMPHATVSAAVTQRDDPAGLQVGDRVLAVGADGVDDVELLLAPHTGAPARALHRGASGGELSRVMLAVEVVFAGSDPVPLMVFDEVDAGVGGKAAVEVGRRLAALARDHQVVVVTHLPQVAAFGDHHLQVVKTDDGSVTSSGVVRLDDDGRVAELSRMMAGLDSGLARGHAEELLAAAAADKGR